jgi:hypothetical protein
MTAIAETGKERGDFTYIDTSKPDYSDTMKEHLVNSFEMAADPL